MGRELLSVILTLVVVKNAGWDLQITSFLRTTWPVHNEAYRTTCDLLVTEIHISYSHTSILVWQASYPKIPRLLSR